MQQSSDLSRDGVLTYHVISNVVNVSTIGDASPRDFEMGHKRLAYWLEESLRGSHVTRTYLGELPAPRKVIRTVGEVMIFADLNHVYSPAIANIWINVERIARVRREVPALWPLVGLAAFYGLLKPGIDPLSQVREMFREAGVADRVWRLLATQGCQGVNGICQIAHGNRFTAIVRWCQLLSNGEADWLPPRSLVAGLYVGVEPKADGRRPLPGRHWTADDAPFLRAALREGKNRCAAGTLHAFILNELIPADTWWRHCWPSLDGNQKRGGWRWIMSQTHAWQERERHARADAPALYAPPVKRFAHRRFVAVALTSSFDLWIEGVEMRNCLHMYSDRLLQSRTGIYSIRDAATGKRVATVEFGRDPRSVYRWDFATARRIANLPVSRAVEAFCRMLEAELNKFRRIGEASD